MILRWLLAALVVGQSAGCAARPNQAEGQFLTVEIGNFRLSPTDVVYDIKYGLFEPSAAGMSARVSFENPADPKAPLVVEVALREGVLEFDAVSPPIHCISNGRRYKIVTQLLQHGTVVDAVSHELQFAEPAALLRAMNLGAC